MMLARLYPSVSFPFTCTFTQFPFSRQDLALTRPSPYVDSLPVQRSIPLLFSLRSSASSSPLFNTYHTYPNSKKVCSILGFSASDPSRFAFTSDESEKDKLLQVSKRLEMTSIYFKKLGGLGFWFQLVITAIAAAVLSFSVIITGKITSPVTFYATSCGIVAAFLSVFWSFGYIRIAENLWTTAKDPSKGLGRGEVVKSLRNGIGVNVIGMGAAIAGMLVTTVGWLIAKMIDACNSAPHYYHYDPALSLDVFLLLQASVSTIVSNFLGLILSLELLRYVSPLPPPPLEKSSPAAA